MKIVSSCNCNIASKFVKEEEQLSDDDDDVKDKELWEYLYAVPPESEGGQVEHSKVALHGYL